MSDLNEIIQINITREDVPISREGFGTPLVLGTHKVFNERVRIYERPSDMIVDGFTSTDPEYLAVSKALSQTPRVEAGVYVGRRTVDNTIVTASTVELNTDYDTYINGTKFTFNSGGTPTAITIATGLVAAITAGSEPVTASDNLDGTYDLDAGVAGTAYTLSADSNQTISALIPNDSITNDIVAIQNADNDWYAITETLYIEADILELALWAEGAEKLYFTEATDPNIPDVVPASDTTSIAAKLKALNYDRTIVIYSETRQYSDMAWLGKGLPPQPGSAMWAYKTLVGIIATALSATQRSNVLGKNTNYYITMAGRDVTYDGKVASGEWIDIMRGIDWLKADMQERVFSLLANTPKIPYTNAGVLSIEAQIKASLDLGIVRDFIATSPPFVISAPDVKDVSAQDKIDRFLPDVEFQATPAGAILKMRIDGRITV